MPDSHLAIRLKGLKGQSRAISTNPSKAKETGKAAAAQEEPILTFLCHCNAWQKI